MAIPSAPGGGAAPPAAAPSSGHGTAMAVLSTVFFMWGFVTVLNDILVPHLKSIFELTYAQTMLIQFTFFSAYFVMSWPAAKVIQAIGYHKTIVLGLLVMAVGAVLFVPAALIASYALFLGALYVLAAGMTFLQVSANPYVAVLGPPQGASSRLNLVQALNSLGTTVGPAVGGLLILSAVALEPEAIAALPPAELEAYRSSQASSVILPYVGIAVLLVGLAVVLGRFRLPVPDVQRHDTAAGSVWRHRHLALGAVAIFTYVGAEVAIGSFLVNYFVLPEIGGLTPQVAAGYVSFYWGGAMIGRFAGAGLLRVVRTGPAVGTAAAVAALLVLTTVATTGQVAMWSIILVGLFNSILFPSIFTLGIAGLGPLTNRGSGVLIAAIVGGAIVPLLQGAVADQVGVQLSFLVPVFCYIYIVFYGFVGSRVVR